MPKLNIEFDFNNLFAVGEHGLTEKDFSTIAPRAVEPLNG